jgi:apolipoprotein N-acyltransferase
MSILAWMGLVPLLVSIAGRSPLQGFLLSLACGAVFFSIVFNWILVITGYTLLHHAFLAIYLGAYFGFFGLAFCFIARRCGVTPALFAAPFLWVCSEYIRSYMSFLALPWSLLVHSQYRSLGVIQIASLTGAYGVSFLIVLVNAAIAATVLYILARTGAVKSLAFPAVSLRNTLAICGITAALLVCSLIYGQAQTSRPITGKVLKISVVQGSIEQEKKWDRKFSRFIMQTYADLTRQATAGAPDLIVWPETATPRSINRDPELHNEVLQIAQESKAALLIGSSHHQKRGKRKTEGERFFNSAFLIQPQSRHKRQRYDKIRLFPFGEYLPYKDELPWTLIEVPDISGTVAGEMHTVFDLPPHRFGVTICWENIFPDLVRQFVKKGAQFIVNITNEAWFGKTDAPYQFVAMNVFRAVENRVYIVRCANTGVSCFIDPCGRVLNRVKDINGNDIFVRGVLTGSVIPLESKTIYTRYGDWLVWLSFAVSTVILVAALLRKRKAPISKRAD